MDNIVLYSTGCPNCTLLKKKLQKKGINFTENTDKELMIQLNFTKVPVLEVNGKYIEFNEANKWLDERKDNE